MSAADDILNAVKAKVEATFEEKTCHVRRGSEKNPTLAPDMDVQNGCFAVSCNDDRPSEMLWAGTEGVKYTVELAYLTVELPGERDPSADIESVIAQAAKLFLRNRKNNGKPGLEGAPAVSGCKAQTLAPYKLPFGAQTVNASRVRLVFETIEVIG